MRDCESSEFSQIYDDICRFAIRLQPFWFRPFFEIPAVRARLGFDHWSRRWEYPWAVLNADLETGMRVLDVGSGGSPFPLYLGMNGFKCYACDPSLDQGKPKENWRRRFFSFLGIPTTWGFPKVAKKSKRSLPVRYYHDSIQNLSFPDGFFDCVFCLSVVEHIPKSEWSLCMEQLVRVVRPGRRLVLTLDMSTPDANARVYERLLEACPLDLIGNVDYQVPIPDEDKRLRHPGHTYETVGLVWRKR
jgi:SAM-dependent methyltransferase